MNAFENALKQLDIAAKEMELDEDIHEFLQKPMQELIVSIPVKMDDGRTNTFTGFRVQHNTALGPAKGGVRYYNSEDINVVKALAMWMTWKTSLLGLSLGGGKGGIICDPLNMSEGELERLTRGYIRAIYKNIGSEVDSLAPDINTNSQTMTWMLDEYLKLTGKNDKGVVTGKPIEIGGSLGRGDATARGGLYCLREAFRNLYSDSGQFQDESFTVAIQGYGNVGMHVHKLIEKMFPNAKVVALSNVHGGIYYPNGIKYSDIPNPKALVNEPMYDEDYDIPGYISNEDLLELDVDVLIPAALESVITRDGMSFDFSKQNNLPKATFKGNANKIKAKIILELANGPVTSDADPILFANGIHVIPDFLANAGGVVVSWMEMVQNSQNYFWLEKEINDKLDVKMTETYHKVFEISKRGSIDMRTAAYILAVGRVTEAMKLRGWV